MTITPDLLNLTKEQTFSSVAKGTVHIPIALDNSYPAGGYPVDSSTLFGADGFTFRLINGYATNGTSFRRMIHDVANSKLMILTAADGDHGAGYDFTGWTAYCTFHRW